MNTVTLVADHECIFVGTLVGIGAIELAFKDVMVDIGIDGVWL
jgi:hypothetical protein